MGPSRKEFGAMAQQEIRQAAEFVQQLCVYCRGKGVDPWATGNRCPVCSGNGSVRVPWGTRRCAYCYGTGIHHDRRGHRRNLTCQVCGGKGSVHVREPVRTCAACAGTGRNWSSEFGLSCTTCSGVGVVSM